jgi:hypothetical protein
MKSTGTPRWVKVFGVAALLVVVLLLVILVAGRGGHGPSRHGASATAAGRTADPSPGVVHELP